MPRVARAVSPARADNGVASPPSRTRRNLKRTASQALPPTPPRTVKRGSKRRIRGRPASDAPKPKPPSRSRYRGSGLETVLEESDEPDEEITLGTTAGRRLDFGPTTKRRKLDELDARLETLLESLDGEDAENPFWDGPTKGKASEPTDKTGKINSKKDDEKDASTNTGRKGDNSEKTVRIRSPLPPLLSFHGKAPVSPPPSNRRRKKVRGRAAPATETVVEENVETECEPSAESSVRLPDATGESSKTLLVKESLESVEEVSVKPTVSPFPAESAEESLAKQSFELAPVVAEEPTTSLKDELPAVELPPLPSTPKKGKKRMDSPIRDSPNNPFLEDSPASVPGEPTEPRTPPTRAEKPTITYVFRGVRAEFANPIYNQPPEVHERSLLPVEHPDFSPDPACPPKLLFTRPRKRQASPSPTRKSRSKPESRSNGTTSVAANGWDDSDDEAELHVTPPRRLFH